MADLYLTIEEMHRYCIDMLKSVSELCENENIAYFVVYGSLLGTIRHNGPIPWDPDIDIYVPENEIDRFVSAVKTKLNDKYWIDYRDERFVPKPFPRIGLKGYNTEILHIDVFRMSGLPNKKFQQKLLTKRGRTLWVLWKAKTINPSKYYKKNKKKRLGAILLRVLAAPFSVEYIIKNIDRLCEKIDVFSTNYVGRVMGQGAIYEKDYFEHYEMHTYTDYSVRIPNRAEDLLKKMYGDYLKYPSEEYRNKMLKRTFYIEEL